MNNTRETFRLNLIRLRRAVGLTQAMLAEYIDVATGTYQAYEHGSATPKHETVDLIAKALKCEISDFYKEVQSDTKITKSDLATALEPILSLAKLSPTRKAITMCIATGDIQYLDDIKPTPLMIQSLQSLLKDASK
ncbi:MAG: helix-turn-helix transcriptional regulator [Bdellovibrionales bacterium]